MFDNPFYQDEVDLSYIKIPTTYYLIDNNYEIEAFEIEEYEVNTLIQINYLVKMTNATWDYVLNNMSEIDYYKILGVNSFNNYIESEYNKKLAEKNARNK